MDTRNCGIPYSSPFAVCSAVHLCHICADRRESYCNVISVTVLPLVEIFYVKFACRNRGGYVEGSIAFHVVGKPS